MSADKIYAGLNKDELAAARQRQMDEQRRLGEARRPDTEVQLIEDDEHRTLAGAIAASPCPAGQHQFSCQPDGRID